MHFIFRKNISIVLVWQLPEAVLFRLVQSFSPPSHTYYICIFMYLYSWATQTASAVILSRLRLKAVTIIRNRVHVTKKSERIKT